MVYKLLKGHRKLYDDLGGDDKYIYSSIICSKKITGINLYFLIYFLAP